MYKKIIVTFASIITLIFHETYNENILGQESKREWSMLFYIKASPLTSNLIEEKLTQLKNGANKHCYISVVVDQELSQDSLTLEIPEKSGAANMAAEDPALKISLKNPRIIEKYEIEENILKKISEQKVTNKKRVDSILDSFDMAQNKPANNFFFTIIDLDKIINKEDKTFSVGIFNESEEDLRLTDKDLKDIAEKLSARLKKPIDLLFLDMDLCGNIENAFALKDSVKSLIFFQERYNPEIVDYCKILKLLNLSHVRPLDFGKHIIDLFDERIPEHKRFSISLLNLSKINLNLLDSFNNIFSTLGSFISKKSCFLEYVTRARNKTTKFGDKKFVDLLVLYLNLIDTTENIKCTDILTLNWFEKHLKEAYDILKDLISLHKSNFNTTGISIYFPKSGKFSGTYDKTLWAKSTWWLYFLKNLKKSLEKGIYE